MSHKWLVIFVEWTTTHECQASTIDEVVNIMGSFGRGNYQGENNLTPMGRGTQFFCGVHQVVV